MLGEEAVAAGRIPECGARFFCVDPLDGTRGFAKGGDEFTVNIALIENGTPIVRRRLCAGHRRALCRRTGHGAGGQMRSANAAIAGADDVRSIALAALPPQPRVVASDFSGRNERTGDFIAALNGVITHASSSIKFCRVAEGAADLYPRFGDVSEWDAAAGHAILKAAGGDIMLLDGSPASLRRPRRRFPDPWLRRVCDIRRKSRRAEARCNDSPAPCGAGPGVGVTAVFSKN